MVGTRAACTARAELILADLMSAGFQLSARRRPG